jgi:hypothetical protein
MPPNTLFILNGYAITCRWSATITDMRSDACWYGNLHPHNNESHIRTDYGIIPSIEFFPLRKLNLKFFSDFISRIYDCSSYSKATFDSTNSTTGMLQSGFISH